MSFYYCIFSVACLEEEKKNGQKWSKMVKNGQNKIYLSNDGNRRTPPPRWTFSIISYLKAPLTDVTFLLHATKIDRTADIV